MLKKVTRPTTQAKGWSWAWTHSPGRPFAQVVLHANGCRDGDTHLEGAASVPGVRRDGFATAAHTCA